MVRKRSNSRRTGGLRSPVLLLFVMILASLVSGCATINDPEASQEHRGDVVAALAPGSSAGQTLVSRRPGMNGIQIWLALGESQDGAGRLEAALYLSPDDEQPLHTTSIELSQVASGPLTISFPPQSELAGQPYYLRLEVQDVSLQLLGQNEDAYPYGQAYAQDRPLEADLAFRLSYQYGLAALMSDLGSWLGGLWLILPLALVVWLPGRLLLGWSGLGSQFDPGERLALSVGLSLALIPLLMTWTTAFELRWSREGAWAASALLAAALLWQERALLRAWLRRLRSLAQPQRPGVVSAGASRGDEQPGTGVNGLPLLSLPIRSTAEEAGSPPGLPVWLHPSGAAVQEPEPQAMAPAAGPESSLPAEESPPSARPSPVSPTPLPAPNGGDEGLPALYISPVEPELQALVVDPFQRVLHHLKSAGRGLQRIHPVLRQAWLPDTGPWPALALGAVLFFALAVRLIMVRDLAGPAWVDSVHHALITRLIAESGAFPSSYTPYVDIDTANYHAGYHSGLAVFTWLSGLPLEQGMLLYGQVLNALAAPAVYLFTTTFVKNRWAGVAAALIAAAFTPMPAYYTSWGRYTQLAGTLILPPALALLLRLEDARPGLRLPLLVLAGSACAGLFLTHYRVIAFLALLLLCVLFVHTLSSLRERDWIRRLAVRSALVAAAAALAAGLTLPWWPSTLRTLFLPTLALPTGTVTLFHDFSWPYLTAGLGAYTLWAAGLGLLLGLLALRRFSFILPLWVGLMFLIANLGALNLPGVGFVNNTSVEILLFVPVAALGGYAAMLLLAGWRLLLPARLRLLFVPTAVLAVCFLALLGARALLPILNPVTLHLRQADRPALAWAASNIPADETVLINPVAWGYSLYAGSDGGYWLAPLAGRRTVPPPALYGLDYGGPQSTAIAEVSRRVLDTARDPQALHDYLLGQGIHYVYIGAKGGGLSPRLLLESGLFEPLYDRDGVWIFQIVG